MQKECFCYYRNLSTVHSHKWKAWRIRPSFWKEMVPGSPLVKVRMRRMAKVVHSLRSLQVKHGYLYERDWYSEKRFFSSFSFFPLEVLDYSPNNKSFPIIRSSQNKISGCCPLLCNLAVLRRIWSCHLWNYASSNGITC